MERSGVPESRMKFVPGQTIRGRVRTALRARSMMRSVECTSLSLERVGSRGSAADSVPAFERRSTDERQPAHDNVSRMLAGTSWRDWALRPEPHARAARMSTHRVYRRLARGGISQQCVDGLSALGLACEMRGDMALISALTRAG